jgi:hypothetical protein
MAELLELYLLTYHKECLTKNNFMKNHFYTEANKILHNQVKQSEKKHHFWDRLLEWNFNDETEKQLHRLSKQFEKNLIYTVFETFEEDLRDRMIQDLMENYVGDR